MRAKFINENDFYSDIGFSNKDKSIFKRTENPFSKLADLIKWITSNDKIKFADMSQAFDSAKSDFIKGTIFNSLAKNGINFYEDEKFRYLYKADINDDFHITLQESNSGYSYYVDLFNKTEFVDSSTYSTTLHTLLNNIDKLLKKHGIDRRAIKSN